MTRIYQSVEELIGNTPLLELNRLEQVKGISGRLLAKLEYLNPAGSAKDRIAAAMIADAERRGLLQKDSVIIEPTSGNTGIGLAAVGCAKGYRVLIVMPDSMSEERRSLMRAYGAELVLTEGSKGMQGAIDEAKALTATIPHSFMPGQFENPANVQAHYETTGPEIWRDSEGKIDFFVAGVGTGGTITGAGRYLKEQNPGVKVIAVEPAASPLLSKGYTGPHGLQGIGANFIPDILDTTVYDEIFTVTDEEAYAAARELGRREGVLVGISGGAALFAAIAIAKRQENAGKTVVTLLPDIGDRYLSTPLFAK
ncbi:MAG TPA: cysteine synthase A [Clostridiales bacterium]|nr:cysteine synthase A [Clostridiales bacterium]